MSEYVLELKDITKRFPGVVALNRVQFQLKKGEIHALMGENGAGKSTLIKVITGVHKPDEGHIFVNGEEVFFQNTNDSAEKKISAIYQHSTTYMYLSVTENIFMGHELKNRFGLLDWPKMHGMAKDLPQKIPVATRSRAGFFASTRDECLSPRGGMWMDATIFTTKKIPEGIFDMKYFTVKHAYKNVRNVSKERWTGFLQASESNNILSDFVYHFFLEYWKKQKILIHYLLIDYVYALAYNEIPTCRKILDSVPLSNPDLYSLDDLMSSRFDEALYKKLTAETMFFKLTWKKTYKESAFGGETFYGHLLHS